MKPKDDSWLDIPYLDKDMESVRQVAIKKINEIRQQTAQEILGLIYNRVGRDNKNPVLISSAMLINEIKQIFR